MQCVSRTIIEESKSLAKLSLTLSLLSLGSNLLFPIMVAFAGRIGNIPLAAVALTNGILNSSANAIADGLSNGGDTFLSQAYGSRKDNLVGILVQRSWILLTLGVCVLSPIYINLENIFVHTGQNPDIAKIAGEYVLWYLPGIYLMQIWKVISKYLACRHYAVTCGTISCIGCLVTALCMYVFINVLQLSPWCCGLALDITWLVVDTIALTYIHLEGSYEQYWPGWSLLAFDDMWYYIKCCFSAMLVQVIDWCATEVLIMLAGLLGVIELAAQGVYMSVYSQLMAISYGVQIALAMTVGQALGFGDHERASRTVKIAYAITAVEGIIILALLAALRNLLPYIFTSSEVVADAAATMAFVMGCMQFAESFVCIGRGVNRGSGNVQMALLASIITFCVIGIPLGAFLMLKTPLSITGGWMGLTIPMTMCAVVYFVYYIFFANWKELSQKALQRIEACVRHPIDEPHEHPSTRSLEVSGLLTTSYDLRCVHRSCDKDYSNASVSTMVDDNRGKLIKTAIAVIAAACLFVTIGIGCRIFIPIPRQVFRNMSTAQLDSVERNGSQFLSN